ncbi:MAG: DHHW family protein [Bacilli bacterium]
MSNYKNTVRASIIVVPFLAVIFGGFVVNAIDKDQKVSNFENRTLAQSPEISRKKVLDGTFTKEFETYFSDQFVRRDTFIKWNTVFQMRTGKPVINGYAITKDGYLLPASGKGDVTVTPANPDNIIAAAESVNKLGKQMQENNIPFYYAATPHRTTMLADDYPSFITPVTRDYERNLFRKSLDNSVVNTIFIDDYFRTLDKPMKELYWKTDHHWNGLGAQLGYQHLLREMDALGDTSAVSEKIQLQKYKDRLFVGSYATQLYDLVTETTDVNIPKVNGKSSSLTFTDAISGKTVASNTIFETDMNQPELSYNTVYFHGSGALKIKNDKPLIDKRIVVFKDSYINALAYAFGQTFRETLIIDVRYIKKGVTTPADLALQFSPDVALVAYNNMVYNGQIFEFDKVAK